MKIIVDKFPEKCGCCCSESSRHTLEPDKIEKILNTKIENCKFWDMVQKRAKELCYG